MKNLVNLLIGLSAVGLVITVISRLTIKPVLGIESHAIADFVVALLLFAIALSVKK